MSNLKIDIIVAVWGDNFIGPFLTVALPSMLSPGNMPVLALKSRIRLQIFTSASGAAYMKSTAVIQKARQYSTVNFYTVGSTEEMSKSSTYHLHTVILQNAIGIAEKEHADFVIFAPDFIVSDGTMPSMRDALHERCGCVMIPSIRTSKFPLLSEMLRIHGWEIAHTQSLTISSRELAAFALRHLHPLLHSAIVTRDADGQTHCRPPLFYWKVDEVGLVVRSMVWSPIYVRPRHWPKALTPTIDFQDFSAACGIRQDEIVPATDSDENLIVEFSSFTADFYQVDRAHATIDCVIDWIGRLGMPHHLENLKYSYVMHTTDLAQTSAAHVQQDASETAIKILEATVPLVEFKLAPRLWNDVRTAKALLPKGTSALNDDSRTSGHS